jgi:hypothetical protein
MDFSNDEIRRQSREIDREMQAVMPRWRSALQTLLAGEANDSPLGPRSRRSFLRLGGVTVLGAAVLAACGNGDNGTEGSTETTEGGTETTEGGGANLDLALARTAASLEILAVDTYNTAIDSGLVKNVAVADAAKLFRDHHQAHADALNGAIKQAGGMEVTERNQAVFDALVAPAVQKAKAEADVARLALDLESAAAQAYTFAASQLSTPQLRSTIMTIGGIEARHAAILRVVALGGQPAEVFPEGRAFFPGDNPLANIPGAVLSG